MVIKRTMVFGNTPPIKKDGITLDKDIQALLNRYKDPVILCDDQDNVVISCNNTAQQELGLSLQQLKGTNLYDHFKSHSAIQHTVIWERQKQLFNIQEAKVVLAGKSYIKAILKPVQQDKSQDLIEMQKEMARLLVHRFNSPLNGMSGFLELLQQQDLTEKQDEYTDAINEGLEDLKHILSRLHKIADDIEVQYSTIDVENFARNIIDEYPPDQRRRVILTIDPDVVELKSDVVLLKSMIRELLDNALEFSQPPQESVDLHFRSDSTIRVTNYGTPIPESFAQKMFYPFYSNKARGIGLGLTQCLFYARELGYEVVLAENFSSSGISFDIRMK